MLEESVVYQDILRKGRKQGKQSGLQEGIQQGLQQGLLTIVQQQLERRFGKLSSAARHQIERLTVAQLEALGVALLEFQTPRDMQAWLQQPASKS